MPTYTCTPSRKKIAVLAGVILCLLGTSFVSIDLNMARIPFASLDEATAYDILHVPLFIFVTILWLQIIAVYRLAWWQRALSAFCFSFLVGVIYEAVQILNPGRSPSLTDIVINSVSSLAGIVLYSALERSRPGFFRKIVCED